VLPFLLERWARAFRTFHPDAVIEATPPYGGGPGAKRLIAGEADFSLQSRELRPIDREEFRQAFGYEPLLIPISGGSWRHHGFLDALTVIVQKDNPIERITYAQFDAIFSKTRRRGHAPITTWDKFGLGGDWRGKVVSAWAPKAWNGYEEFVRQRVLSLGPLRGEWRDDLNFTDLVIPIAGSVAADPGAIGYTGMAFLNEGVKSLAIAEGDGGPFRSPTQDEVARGTYPLRRVFYLVANRAPGQPLDARVAELVGFILSREGQREVIEHGTFDPLRSDALHRSLALLR
jgi:phosphate transport system substrate-binding protein